MWRWYDKLKVSKFDGGILLLFCYNFFNRLCVNDNFCKGRDFILWNKGIFKLFIIGIMIYNVKKKYEKYIDLVMCFIYIFDWCFILILYF